MEDEKKTDRPLPADWEWRAPTTYAHAWLGHADDKPDGASAVARSFGHWTVFRDRSTRILAEGRATPRPGESLLAAAQREAEAALWARDGFGVGRVYGLALGDEWTERVGDALNATGATLLALPGLPGLWRVTRVSSARPLTIDAVRAPDTQAAADAAPLTHALDAEGNALCPYDAERLAYVSQRPERVTCPRCREAMAEPAPREPSAPALDAPVYGYAASEDAEEWSAPYSSREEAISAASEDSDLDGGEIWIVKGRRLDPAAAMPSAWWLIEMMPDGAAEQNWYEGAVEALEATIGNLPPEAIAELDAALAAWARRWCPMRGSWEGTGRAERVREASDGDEG